MDREIKVLSDQIRSTSLSLHSYLKHGHLEKVYEHGLLWSGYTNWSTVRVSLERLMLKLSW